VIGRHRSIYLPPWRVDVVTRPGVEAKVADAAIARAVARALAAARAPEPGAVTVVLTDDQELADLNREHMGIDGPYLRDAGGAVSLTTFDEIVLACDSWGSGHC